MTATEKMEIANQFRNEGNESVFDAIVETLSDNELLELLTK